MKQAEFLSKHHTETVLIGSLIIGVYAAYNASFTAMDSWTLALHSVTMGIGVGVALHAFGRLFQKIAENSFLGFGRWAFYSFLAAAFIASSQITLFAYEGPKTPASESWLFWLLLDFGAFLFVWTLLRVGGMAIDGVSSKKGRD